MHVVELHRENIVEEDVITESMTYLREHGYVAAATTAYVVVSDSGHGYLVQEVDTHTVPFSEADASEDQYTLWMCNCHSYRYHDGLPDLEESRVVDWQACKHITAAVREVRAENDEQQETLTDG